MKNILKHLKARSEIIIGRLFIVFGLVFLVLSFVESYSFFIMDNIDVSVLLIVSGILFLYRSTRQLGWFMAGCISAITLYGFVAGEPLFTDPTLNYITYLLFGAWIILCVWFCLKHELKKEDVDQEYDNRINELEKKNRKLEEQLVDLQQRLPEEELAEDQEEDNSVLVEGSPDRKMLLRKPKQQGGEKRMQLYENQLVSLFKIALFANSDNNKPHKINYIEDGSDRELDDLIAQTENIFWLLEVKHDKDDIADEEANPKRRTQFRALMKPENDTHKNIARKCHWIGWSEQEDSLLFSNYWGTVFDGENTPHITFRRFVELTFRDSNPIGSSHKSFDEYVSFLFEVGGEATSGNSSPTVIIFCKSESGDINMTEATLLELYTAMHHAKNRKKGVGVYPLDVD